MLRGLGWAGLGWGLGCEVASWGLGSGWGWIFLVVPGQ